ncbi:SpoIIIAH-like family protein [Terrisporobacter glycolicus]|nr:SpoIIIAH-like family protein [Terrisporobacter glycolicus]
MTVVDSKDSESDEVKDKAVETSKEIEEQLTSKENMNKSTYILDMKMTREKQRNDLSEELNEIINNPSTTDKSREEASNMKLQLVKYQETELKIENLLSAKGFENALVYIGEGNVNVVVNKQDLSKSEAARIFDLVAQQAGVSYDKIKLMNSYSQK